MSTPDLRLLLDEHWRGLDAAPVAEGHVLRTSSLPVATAHGPLLAAVDTGGMRHLLIPLATRQRLSAGVASGALRIFERPLEDDESYGRFADITCTNRELDDVFTGLCRDVLVALAADGERPYRTARAVVEHWRRLFSGGRRPLTDEQVIGLFGELLVLIRLLERDPEAVRHWAGPEGERHDFTDGRLALEVKSSATVSERRLLQVHGLDQLEPPEGGELFIAWQRLQPDPRGRTLDELVAHARDLCDDEAAFLSKLARLGYQRPDQDQDSQRLAPVESRWYPVDDGFPRLTTASIPGAEVPAGVFDVRYTVDLVGIRTDRLDDEAVNDVLARMGEST
ncbi:PD-(D/E)XK motif protein [Kitasatospora sp. NPDC097691]|uniref:PD-(D/E)XK motif protein n=1 Tax=Kitasatospora sp. NPDC097691 TaxID=3157231 RepID=UPI00332E862E